jgi:peptidoglycan-binding protein ArfA
VGLGARFGQTAATTDSSRAPGFYRRSPGLPWLIGLVVIPLLIAALGYFAFEKPQSSNEPTGAPPTSASPSKSGAPKLSLAPLSIARSGNVITLSGNFPDDSAKALLMNALKASLPPDVNIVDQIQLNPDVDALDFSNAGPIFKDSASIIDFNLTVNGDTVTLAGTAASPDQKTTIKQDATSAWSNLNVVDTLTINGTPAPPGPPVPPGPPPPPAPPGPCTDLQAAINAVTGGPIAFGSDGFSPTPAGQQILTQVADKLKACPNAHATINGYTDNSGSEAINIPLSTQRAQAVADFLVAHGVPSSQLIVKGLGSVNPVAPNDTPDGRAKNRRAEIVVS